MIDAAATRAKPIVLTAVAAMLGAVFLLDDPIFNGLAISLLFGILVSTLLTLVVIPILYYAMTRNTTAAPSVANDIAPAGETSWPPAPTVSRWGRAPDRRCSPCKASLLETSPLR